MREVNKEELIKEINEDLKKLTEILNNYYDNYANRIKSEKEENYAE